MSTGQSYSIAGAGGGGGINLGPYTIGEVNTGERKKFSNHKLTINIYGAQGGYIVEAGTSVYGETAELHIIPDTEDFDRALGKIITHHQLKQT